MVIISSTSRNELAASYPSFLVGDTKCGKEGGYGSYLETPNQQREMGSIGQRATKISAEGTRFQETCAEYSFNQKVVFAANYKL